MKTRTVSMASSMMLSIVKRLFLVSSLLGMFQVWTSFFVMISLTSGDTNNNRIQTSIIVVHAQSDYYNDNNDNSNNNNNDYYYGGVGGMGDDVDNVDGVGGGDYQDYPSSTSSSSGGVEDNLYADYAAHQQGKLSNNDGVLGGRGGGGGIGFMKMFAGCAASWYVGGKFHSNRLSKKLKAKFQKEQKQLYTQYYNDVYKLSEQNAELSMYTEKLKDTLKDTEAKHELETIQREYDEFKQPDIDGDDRISRAEFNMYVKNYLSNYPGLTEEDYPQFEDFDHDNDGYVSFTEYAQQMALAAQKAELEQLYGTDSTTGGGGGGGGGGGNNNNKKNKEKSKALNDMYESTVGSARTKMYR